MVLILLIGLLLFGAAAALALRAVVMPRIRAGETLAMIDSYTFSAGSEDEAGLAAAAAAAQRPRLSLRSRFDALATAVGNLLSDRLPERKFEEIRTQLVAAGRYTTTAGQFLGYRVLATVLLPTL